jgi:hypothetical protein
MRRIACSVFPFFREASLPFSHPLRDSTHDPAQNGPWIMNSDSTGRSLFNPAIKDAFVPTLCGSFAVFLSAQSGATALMRADLDGGPLTKLLEGNLISPVCTPDGSYIY